MMNRQIRIGEPLFVLKKLNASGRRWEPGTPFPWRQLALSKRQVKILFDARYICHAEELKGLDAVVGTPILETGGIDPEHQTSVLSSEVKVSVGNPDESPKDESPNGDADNNTTEEVKDSEPTLGEILEHRGDPPTETEVLDMLTTPSETGIQ